MSNVTNRRHGPVDRREFEDLQDSVGDLMQEFTEIKELIKINTDLTSDIRAILRSSKILVGFIKGLGVVAGAVAAVYALFHQFWPK